VVYVSDPSVVPKEELEDRNFGVWDAALVHDSESVDRQEDRVGRLYRICGVDDRLNCFVHIVDDLVSSSRRPCAGSSSASGDVCVVDETSQTRRGVTE